MNIFQSLRDGTTIPFQVEKEVQAPKHLHNKVQTNEM